MPGTLLGIKRGLSGSFGTESESITLTALVRMDEATEGPNAAIQTVGIPAYGSYYQFGAEVRYDLILTRADPQQNETAPRYWDVVLTYETRPVSGDESPALDPGNPEHIANPLARPAEVVQGYRMERRALDEAYDVEDPEDFSKGLGIDSIVGVRNSAGERFTNPAFEDDFPITTWSITKNVTYADKLFLETSGYTKGVLNSDTVILDGVESTACYLFLLPVSFRRVRERGLLYYQATFNLERHDLGWIRRVLDNGPRDINGKPPTGEAYPTGGNWNLDGSGAFLAAGADPVFLAYRTKTTRPFSPLIPYWT